MSKMEAALWAQLDEIVALKTAQEAKVAELQQQLLSVKGDEAAEMPLRLAIREAKEPLFEICRDHATLAKALSGKRRPE